MDSSFYAQNERAGNYSLRIENEKIRCENLALQEVLKNIICPSCNGSGPSEEEKHNNLEMLKMENLRLKEEHERTMSLVSSYMGISTVSLLGSKSLRNMHGEHFCSEVTTLDHEHVLRNSENTVSSNWSSGIQEINKPIIIETAVSAMDELIELFRVNEAVWMKAPPDGRYTLHYDSYNKLFPKPSHFKTASARFESSYDSAEVAMAARHLTEMLLDVDKWKYMFPTIVMKAKTIEVHDTGCLGGSLQWMYEKMHVLSPLVAPREFFFIRYCRQLNSSTWVMVDVSHDFIKELQDAAPTRCWKLPSGCIIEDMSNGKSTVTWIEHVQVDDKSLTHRLYRDLVSSCEAYGAKRWITSLQRMCERFAFSMGITPTPERGPRGVIDSPDGRRNLMKLSHRMVMNFCEALSMSHKSNSSQLLELENNGVLITLRKSDGLVQPDGVIVTATTSLWLPLAKEDIFNFLKDEKKRVQWDDLFNGNLVNIITHISTGKHSGNFISIIQQPFSESKENNMFMLQESSIDHLGAVIIYAPIELPAIVSVANGDDPMKIPLLPSGFVISGDGLAYKSFGASSSSTTNNSSGSLLTAAFQILACQSPVTKQLNMESVTTLHSLLSSTVQNIKVALDCSDKD
ncbi:hypothetical protein CDL12_20846 [Handroanthus impetiginosus]|uniref:START domain-containing protein n=1 Tax=Handroanthus impetiginosus TaxID=429701 RepID=A0A2G9GMW6_9LAMI|nr:hypothetical protein CDL12_20846 [Handroanthus impetiginosus]